MFRTKRPLFQHGSGFLECHFLALGSRRKILHGSFGTLDALHQGSADPDSVTEHAHPYGGDRRPRDSIGAA
jgi:hypothetical protein